MKKKFFYLIYIFILIMSNTITAVIISLDEWSYAMEKNTIYKINMENQNVLLLQTVISRLEKQDTLLLNKLKHIQDEAIYTYEKFDILSLLKKYFPDEFN